MKVFGTVGTVLQLTMAFDQATGKTRGRAFCKYRDEVTAIAAVDAFNGLEFNGRVLHVALARGKAEKARQISCPNCGIDMSTPE